jgi:hypothetical protein
MTESTIADSPALFALANNCLRRETFEKIENKSTWGNPGFFVAPSHTLLLLDRFWLAFAGVTLSDCFGRFRETAAFVERSPQLFSKGPTLDQL